MLAKSRNQLRQNYGRKYTTLVADLSELFITHSPNGNIKVALLMLSRDNNNKYSIEDTLCIFTKDPEFLLIYP